MDDINFYIPFTKIDKKRRIVTGVATSTMPDQEDDLLEMEASLEAFENWIGNVREMHEPIAVGKRLDARSIQVASKDGEMYDAIEVDVYISKGAESTWQKILDGTLKGFSIGGGALEKSFEFDEKSNRRIRRIKKYMMTELSLVDNPCNPLAMITMVKSVDGKAVDVENLDTHTMFYCKTHKFVKTDDSKCVYCDNIMVEIGHTVNFDTEEVSSAIRKFMKGDEMDLHVNDDHDMITDMENIELTEDQKERLSKRFVKFLFGGENDSPTEVATDESAAVSSSTQPIININIPGNVADIEKVLTTSLLAPSTVKVEEEVIEEVVDSNKSENIEGGEVSVEDTVVVEDAPAAVVAETSNDDLLKSIGNLLDSKLGDLKAEVDSKIDALSKSVDEVKSETASTVEDFKNDLNKVASAAGSKSEIIDEDVVDSDVLTKSAKPASLWNGIFVPLPVVEILGYES